MSYESLLVARPDPRGFGGVDLGSRPQTHVAARLRALDHRFAGTLDRDGSPAPRQSPRAHGEASGQPNAPSSPSCRPGGSYRAPPRPEHDGDCHG